MSQVPSHFQTGDTTLEPSEVPPFSLAAITSLVFSLLFCIPGLAILGLLTGIIGIFTTSGGARRGRGLAITGVVLSLLVGAVWLFGIFTTVPWFMTRVVGTDTFMKTGPDVALKAAFAGDIVAFQDHFMTQSMPSKEEVLAFTKAARAKWGELQGVSSSNPKQHGADGNSFKVDIKLTFETGVVPGEAYFTVGDTESPQLTDIAVFQPQNDFETFMLLDQICIDPSEGKAILLGSGNLTGPHYENAMQGVSGDESAGEDADQASGDADDAAVSKDGDS